MRFFQQNTYGRFGSRKFEILFFEANRPVRDEILVEKPKCPQLTVP
jgi:hypothetical protein